MVRWMDGPTGCQSSMWDAVKRHSWMSSAFIARRHGVSHIVRLHIQDQGESYLPSSRSATCTAVEGGLMGWTQENNFPAITFSPSTFSDAAARARSRAPRVETSF